MIRHRIIKIYYIVLFIFMAILTTSYLNIAKGGAVLWVGPNIFYFSMLIFAGSLTYVILTSSNDHLKNLELPGVLLFCLSLPLLLNIGIHQFPPDLDSIISIQTIPFIINNGFSTDLVGDKDLLISATYSLPMLSILSASFMQILGITHIATAKYIPIIILSIFFLIYYAFISKFINKKTALLSLILFSTFSWGYSGVFNNVDLALVLFVLSWWFLLWRDHYKEYSIVVIIQIIVLITFVITHHLTYVVFILSVIFSSLYSFTIKQKKTVSIGLLAIVLMFSYYIFVYLLPLELIVNTFTNQLVVEGKAMTGITEWTFPIILQRTSYVIFLVPPTIFSIIEIKKNFKKFLLNEYAFFLITGIFLFLFSVMLVITKASINWERITIFAWMFYLPGAINVLIESEILKSQFIKQSVIIFTLSLLVLGNIYAIPVNIIDHSGDKEYEGSFKNWIKVQEWHSGLWIIKHGDNNKIVIGDEPVRRIYLTHAPDFKGHFKFIPETLREIKNSEFTYMVIRNENFYQVVGGFYVAKGDKWQKYAIKKDTYEKISFDRDINSVYDNKEVKIFYRTGD